MQCKTSAFIDHVSCTNYVHSIHDLTFIVIKDQFISAYIERVLQNM